MYHPPARKTKGMRIYRPGIVLALLIAAALLVLYHMHWGSGGGMQGDAGQPAGPQDTFMTRAAALDDPVGFKGFWLQQQGHRNTSTLEAVEQQKHSSEDKRRAAQLAQPGVLCTNTCFKANDGVCDEGRRGNLTVPAGTNWVYCDLGTDCGDCGPWQGAQHGPGWTEGMGPIAYLQLYKIEVRVKLVPFAPSFVFAFTDPAIDRDQSEHTNVNGVVEPGISHVFYKVLSQRCRPDAPGSQGYVVDVGGNYGWFSLLSASVGCSVTTIEPVPVFRAFMEYASARNHLTPLIEVIPAVVALNTSATYTINAPLIAGAQWGASGMDVPNHPGSMQVPARAVNLDRLAYPKTASLRALLDVFGVSSSSKSRGTSAARGLLGSIVSISSSSSSTISSSGDSASDAAGSSQPPGDDAAATSAAREGGTADGSSSSSSAESKRATQRSSRTVSSSSKKQPVLASTFLPAKLQDGIDILKVDVEGREPDVFATAGRLLASGKVQNIIMEYSPGYYYQVTDRLADMQLLPSLLLEVLRHNYSMVHIPWNIAHDSRAVKLANSWDTPLPVMDAITAPQLMYDMWTTERIRNGSLPGMHGAASWPCPEMAKSGMTYAERGYERLGMHVAFHPKSFMAHFVFNTNVWATKDKSLQAPGTALFNDRELFPFYYPANTRWFPQSATSDTHTYGLPWVYCPDIQPRFQVAHRCRCRNWDVCGQHQVAVQQCVLKKRTGYENLPDEHVSSVMNQAALIMAERSRLTST